MPIYFIRFIIAIPRSQKVCSTPKGNQINLAKKEKEHIFLQLEEGKILPQKKETNGLNNPFHYPINPCSTLNLSTSNDFDAFNTEPVSFCATK